ncbi:MAG TPA: hypothetical protein DCG53_13095 [Syntrophus sp. (in: bacteria)]|jgi:hypothetical protein|nr:hypothetical protein [Syntrophus sp. (in: bacteria)]
MLALILVLFVFFLFILYFVNKGSTLTAQEALGNYLNAVIGGRTEAAYNYLSAADKAKESLPDYKNANSLGSGLIAQVIGGKISFALENLDITGDRATATVAMTSPDFPLMIQDIFQSLPPAGIPGQTLETLTFVCRHISHFLDKYQGKGLPMQTTKETFSLLREGDGWKIKR